jgi:hypothetical protein
MADKKRIRDNFRNGVFARDRYRCVVCGVSASELMLDAHHIMSRDIMPFGGYCRPNGVTLCTDRLRSGDCHNKAEKFHATGISLPGYSIAQLYDKIRSSYPVAYMASLTLGLATLEIQRIAEQISHVQSVELEVRSELDVPSDTSTWELACEKVGCTDALVLLYGKGLECLQASKRMSSEES